MLLSMEKRWEHSLNTQNIMALIRCMKQEKVKKGCFLNKEDNDLEEDPNTDSFFSDSSDSKELPTFIAPQPEPCFSNHQLDIKLFQFTSFPLHWWILGSAIPLLILSTIFIVTGLGGLLGFMSLLALLDISTKTFLTCSIACLTAGAAGGGLSIGLGLNCIILCQDQDGDPSADVKKLGHLNNTHLNDSTAFTRNPAFFSCMPFNSAGNLLEEEIPESPSTYLKR